MAGFFVSERFFNVFSVNVDVCVCVCVHYYVEHFGTKLLTNNILRGTAKISRKFNLLDIKIKLL